MRQFRGEREHDVNQRGMVWICGQSEMGQQVIEWHIIIGDCAGDNVPGSAEQFVNRWIAGKIQTQGEGFRK